MTLEEWDLKQLKKNINLAKQYLKTQELLTETGRRNYGLVSNKMKEDEALLETLTKV